MVIFIKWALGYWSRDIGAMQKAIYWLVPLSLGGSQVFWIANKLGVDEFEIKEGKTLQDTLMAVGQYLTPDFYIDTKVGLSNRQAVLVLKHKLTNNINLETQASTSQRAKINYEFDSD
jgi:translocation and assembly module TamB